MTADELTELITDCPLLYHMAEQDSWPTIRSAGLLSTTALLDHFNVEGATRTEIESKRRPKSVRLERNGQWHAIVRDQSPMNHKGLSRCLEHGMSPTDWYRTLNAKVFFWLTRDRLVRLLNAGNYRSQEHDVLVLDARLLVEAYRDRVWFCPINSGCTQPFPTPRGSATFQRISDYPYAERKRKNVASVLSNWPSTTLSLTSPSLLREFVRMKGDEELSVLFEA